jgi:hypothetical protein
MAFSAESAPVAAVPSSPVLASLWNEGGFQWETRDVSALADAALRAGVATLSSTGALGANARGGLVTVSVSSVASTAVDASLTVRRGALSALFDVSVALIWEATWTSPAGAATRIVVGDAVVRSVGPDDVASDFSVRVRTTQAPPPASRAPPLAAAVMAAEALAQHALAAQLRDAIRALLPWLIALGASGGAGTRADAGARAAEREKTAAAVAEGRTPAAIAAVAAAAETAAAPSAALVPTAATAEPAPPPPSRAAPLVAAAAALERGAAAVALALPIAAHRVPRAGAVPAVAPSSWNSGGWGYEDKSIRTWAHARLREALLAFDVALPGAHVAVVEADVLGDADIVLRAVRFDISPLARANPCERAPPSLTDAAAALLLPARCGLVGAHTAISLLPLGGRETAR